MPIVYAYLLITAAFALLDWTQSYGKPRMQLGIFVTLWPIIIPLGIIVAIIQLKKK